MNIDITPLFQAVISLAAVLITAFLIPWLKTKVSAEKRETIAYWLEVAVAAAEEQIKGSGMGAEKLAFVTVFLANKGYTWSAEETATLVNATVWQLINCWKDDALPIRGYGEGTD